VKFGFRILLKKLIGNGILNTAIWQTIKNEIDKPNIVTRNNYLLEG
jgi:hypothetical protein